MPTEPPPTRWELPDPQATREDIVGCGADLQPGTVLAAYRRGLFPMNAESLPAQPGWWSPARRGVLRLDSLVVHRSLRQTMKHFEIRVDTAFDEVISACADPDREHGWIDEEVIASYTALHQLGWAHSVEAWRDGELAGGLYGVAVAGLFAGESMFHRSRDASKVALVALVDLLRDEYADRRLLDTQWSTPHLASLGVEEITRDRYLALLEDALTLPLPRPFAT